MNNSAERAEVSLHEVRVYRAFLGKPKDWLTNKETSALSGVNERTTRLHTLRLVRLGILEQAQVFPGHRYRLAEKQSKQTIAYAMRLAKAAEVFANQIGG
jgi:hypothetical protein